VRDAVADAIAVEPGRPVRAEAPPRLVAAVDEPRIRQVLANLLGNVRAHTPPATPVAVRLGEVSGGVLIEVAAAGPGMSAEDASRAFDRFHRAAQPDGGEPGRGGSDAQPEGTRAGGGSGPDGDGGGAGGGGGHRAGGTPEVAESPGGWSGGSGLAGGGGHRAGGAPEVAESPGGWAAGTGPANPGSGWADSGPANPGSGRPGVGGGSGLGLSIVQAIARAHGGQAALESWPGRGTRVRIWLPARNTP